MHEKQEVVERRARGANSYVTPNINTCAPESRPNAFSPTTAILPRLCLLSEHRKIVLRGRLELERGLLRHGLWHCGLHTALRELLLPHRRGRLLHR